MTQNANRRAFLAVLPLVVVAGAAHASAPDKAATEPSVRLASVGIPVMKDKVVVNYLFLTLKLNLNSAASETKMREMEPIFRDTIIRVAHRTSFGKPDRDDQLDEPRFKSVMMTELGKVAGAGMLKSIEILNQSPKKFRGKQP